MHKAVPNITEKLVFELVASQFPHWKNLPIRQVALSGWDNRTFHLGKNMLVRLPSAERYAAQVEKEQFWLPKLAPSLPLPIPTPLAIGEPTGEYPWRWSVYAWLPGNIVTSASIDSLSDIAGSLARFLLALQAINTDGGPLPGPDNFHRGGAIKTYDADTRQAILWLKNKVDADTATDLWDTALSTVWQRSPVWVHGDISADNLLVQNGQLSAVIDFGQLAVGDPACDLTAAWTVFEGESKHIFQSSLALDEDTWARARGWAMWKALITIASGDTGMNQEAHNAWYILGKVLADHRQNKASRDTE